MRFNIRLGSKIMQRINKNANKAGAMASSTTEITKEAEGIRVNTQSTVKSSNFVFPDDKATEYTTMDGRKTMVRTFFIEIITIELNRQL